MSVPEKMGSMVRLVLKIALPICLILAGMGGYQYFSSKELKMKRQPPEKRAPVVETITLEPGDYQSYVQVMGTVLPNREIILKSKLAGEVVFVSPDFVQGGLMKKGETLLMLDDSDYRIEVRKAHSALDKALSDLSLEQGNQLIAREELRLMSHSAKAEMTQTDLALRKPQLIQANAAVETVRAELERVRLNLSRTTISVPFNALVLEKHLNDGSLVTAQGSVATLVDVDTYRVDALVPPDMLSVIRVSETDGSEALIYSQYSDQTWTGKVVRTTGQITSQSRMAGVIILVSDPLGLKTNATKSELLLGDHVDIRIKAEIFENAYAIPRTFLREKDTLWIYRSGKLEIKDVTPLWKEEDRVFIRSGLSPGDKVIASDLPAPVRGMSLQSAKADLP